MITKAFTRSFQNQIQRYIPKNQTWKHKIYGDTFQAKQEGVCRIVSQNINCIGIAINGNYKEHMLKEWMWHNSIDI